MALDPGRPLCRRCVLPHAPPDVTLDESGLCSVCREHDDSVRGSDRGGRDLLETDFVKLLEKRRGKQTYDCLVMLSGGKDSTSALHTIVRKYRLNPLVFTFDHGFVGAEAIQSAMNTVQKLDVDFLFYRSTFMHDLFRELIRSHTRANICPICSMWYMLTTYEIAAKYKIPLIISGWTKGQTSGSGRTMLTSCACNESSEEYRSMSLATREFMKDFVSRRPRYKDFPRNMEEVLKAAKKRFKSKAIVLSPHWFMSEDAEEYVEVIQRELDWKGATRSYPKKTTNCELNFVATYLTVAHYGYSHYHIEMSKMIRLGMVTRKEALEALEIDYGAELLDPILARLDLTFDDLGVT